MKGNEINGYQTKELLVADVIANMRDCERIMITDMRTLNYVFFGHISDLKSYSEDEIIQAILKLNVLSIGVGVNFAYRYHNLYINTPDDGKFDVDYLINRLKNIEHEPMFFDQMITYNTTRVGGEENKSLKNIVEEFKNFATANTDDIDVKHQPKPICPFQPISENPGESYELLSQRNPITIPHSVHNNSNDSELKVTIVKARQLKGGTNNDNQ